MAINTAKKDEIIEIAPIKLRTVSLRIVGDTPMIFHNWSEKARKEMLDAQQGKKIKKREAKNPYGEFAGSLYWMDGAPKVSYQDWTQDTFDQYAQGARFGFPASAIKQSALSAAYRLGYAKNKVSMTGSFFIKGEGEQQLVQIKSNGIPMMREDPVKIAMTTDLRYRGYFAEWWADLEISYNENGNLSLSDIVNLINLGGATVGIGEWRVEKSGQFGMFHVAASSEE